MRVCVIGCGNVGKIIAKHKDLIGATLRYFDRNLEKCKNLCEGCEAAESFEDFLKGCDLIVEAASPEAVRSYAESALRVAPLVVLSVGALLDEDLLRRLLEVSRKHGNELVVPSGAIAGLDAVKALRIVGIEELELVTTKHPRSLGVKVEEKRVLFEGRASEAVKKFPFNVNVVAALSLAAGKEARVKIVADPSIDKNVHEIFVKSKASTLHIRVENVPSPDNPKTSYLAALSVIETIRERLHRGGLIVGT